MSCCTTNYHNDEEHTDTCENYELTVSKRVPLTDRIQEFKEEWDNLMSKRSQVVVARAPEGGKDIDFKDRKAVLDDRYQRMAQCPPNS